MPSIIGRRFGRYELLQQIGAGGMGEVYRACDHDLHRDVAIKFLPERFASDPNRLARFAQEARTASSLNHPNIVTIHEIGQVEARPYIVMEYVDGETLRQLCQRAPLSAKQTLEIGAQLADGLAKAHAARIVHRDLKPENVMITKDGFAKILDFGLAKLRGDAEDAYPIDPVWAMPSEAVTELSPNTAVGVLLGTAGYMAPEQARGLPADYRSDQFALGAILYEMATGRRAFHRESMVQTLSAIIDTEPRPIAEFNPSFPAPARWPIERCLAKEPEDRYASTLDLARELRGIRERIGEASASSHGLVVAPPRRRTRWLKFGIGAGVILGLLLIPALRDVLLRWTPPAPLGGEVRLAVLLNDAALPAADRERLAGLLDYVVIRLADLNQFRDSFAVVPASEVREAQVRSPRDAKRRIGANRAVSLTVQRARDTLVVSASLEDTDRLRVLGGEQRRFPDAQFSEENVVELIISVLRIELPSSDRRTWIAGATDVAEARALFARGLTQTPYQTAQTALEKYDQEQSLHTAIDYFNRAIELDARYADAHARLGESYLLLYRLTRREEHIALAERNAIKARELDDTRPSTWITLGMIHAQKGAYAEAERAFGHAIARGPRTSPAYRELARVQQRAGEPAKAEANYRKAIALDPEGWSNYSHLAAFLIASKRLDEAEEAFLEATRKAPDNARAWSNLGGLYYLQRRFDDAEKALDRAIGLYEYGPALSNLATVKFRVRRQYAEAARLFERAVKAAPRDYRIWKNLGSAYYWAPGERENAAVPLRRAIEVIEEARRIEPHNAELVADLADAHAMLGDHAQARPLIERAVKLAPSEGRIAVTAAAVWEMLGNRTAALQHVAIALAARVDASEFEAGPTFARLVKDPRYADLTKRR